MKKLILIIIGVLLFSSCEKPIFSKKEYKVSGILYGSDEKTPLANKKLLLWGNRYNQNQALKGQYSESIAETETDSEGYFELIYPKNRKADFVKVVDESGEEFSGVIGINENYYQDLCVVDVGYLVLKVSQSLDLSTSDTLYINISNLIISTDTIILKNNHIYNVIPYPFTLLNSPLKIPHYNIRAHEYQTALHWDLGFKNVTKENHYVPGGQVPPNIEYYTLSGFPYSDTVEIEITK